VKVYRDQGKLNWMVVSNIVLFSTLKIEEMIQFDGHIVQMGGSTTN